jgi:hypothetical protein
MRTEVIKRMIDELNLKDAIQLQDIPNIDLYMDQVITLFEEKLQHTKRSNEDKLLTKTMINNYTKDKLLMPAIKKKYTKEHIILMIILYQMKNVLSIGDIKSLLNSFIETQDDDHTNLVTMYQIYLKLKSKRVEAFEEEISCMISTLNEELEDVQIEKDIDADIFENIMLAILLTEQASYYKKLAEKLMDGMIKPQN